MTHEVGTVWTVTKKCLPRSKAEYVLVRVSMQCPCFTTRAPTYAAGGRGEVTLSDHNTFFRLRTQQRWEASGSPRCLRGRSRRPSCPMPGHSRRSPDGGGIRPPARARRCRWDRRRLRRPATGRSRALFRGRLRSPWEDSPRYHWGWRRQPQDLSLIHISEPTRPY